jgi:hypothetical protein
VQEPRKVWTSTCDEFEDLEVNHPIEADAIMAEQCVGVVANVKEDLRVAGTLQDGFEGLSTHSRTLESRLLEDMDVDEVDNGLRRY